VLSSNWGSWFDTNELGPTYDISDVDGNILYYAGTLCPAANRRSLLGPGVPPPPVGAGAGAGGDGAGAGDGGAGEGAGEGDEDNDGTCPTQLVPGTYVYRVTGFGYPYDVTWEFCNTAGTKQKELLFRIVAVPHADRRSLEEGGAEGGDGAGGEDGAEAGGEDGDYDIICVPIKLRDVVEVCKEDDELLGSTPGSHMVTLEGRIALGAEGIHEELSADERLVLTRAIAQEFSEASPKYSVATDEVAITAWNMMTPASSRKLSWIDASFSELTFRVRVAADKFGVNHQDPAALEVMAMHFQNYLHKSITAGTFTTKVVSHARRLSQKSLQTLSFAELINLVVIHEMKLNKEMSGVASAVVAVGALFGIAFGFVLVRSYTLKKSDYAAISVTSHDNI